LDKNCQETGNRGEQKIIAAPGKKLHYWEPTLNKSGSLKGGAWHRIGGKGIHEEPGEEKKKESLILKRPKMGKWGGEGHRYRVYSSGEGNSPQCQRIMGLYGPPEKGFCGVDGEGMETKKGSGKGGRAQKCLETPMGET